MKNLTKNELITINGGHDGTAYQIGEAVGEVITVALMFSGGGKLLKWVKRII